MGGKIHIGRLFARLIDTVMKTEEIPTQIDKAWSWGSQIIFVVGVVQGLLNCVQVEIAYFHKFS